MKCQRSLVALFSRVALASAAGCGLVATSSETYQSPKTTAAAHLAALSLFSANLGTPIRGTGTGFPANGSHRLQVLFKGEFRRSDGRVTPVNTAVDVDVQSGQEFLWTTFGPYAHPFTARGDEPGTFHGTIGARLVAPDNQNIDDPAPITAKFIVQPSLVVRQFSPITAQCQHPVKRAFSRLPYALLVDAVGFTPRSITYVVSAPDAGYGETAMVHELNGNTSDGLMLITPDIPNNLPSFTLVIRIQAEDTSGQSYQTSFTVGVRDPVEILPIGAAQTAEIYAPELVSGCLAGGPLGSVVTYSEMMSRTVSHSATYSWDRNWTTSHSISSMISRSTTQGFSFTTGKSVTDSHSASATNGWSSTNGFSIDMKDGRSGSWSADQSLSATIHDEAKGSTMNAFEQGSSFIPIAGNRHHGGRRFEPLSLLGGTGPGTITRTLREIDLPGFLPLGPIFLNWMYIYKHTKSNATTGEWQKGFDMGGAIKEHLDEGATQSFEKKQTAEQSINGSETTTDTKSVTNMMSQTLSASVTETRADGTVATRLVDQGMSMTTSEEASSSKEDTKNYRGRILAGQFGAFYRQAIRVVTYYPIVAYDQCGNGQTVGTITSSVYRFAPDLGQSAGCFPLPPSNLPAARCIISPCTGTPPYDAR